MTDRISDVLDGKLDGKKVVLEGWVHNRRSSGGVQFVILRDGTGYLQATAHKDRVQKRVFDDLEKLTQESSVVLEGVAKKDERAHGGYEVSIEDIKIIQLAQEYPLGKKEHGVDFLMNNRHLWIRSPRQIAILKVRAEVIRSCREYLDDNGFVLVDTPILTPSACEDTTTLFDTPYFGKKAYLTQSGQLYNEANIFSFRKVYCFGPTFRAEKSRTTRHLTEFWMVEPEMAFVDWKENIKVQEELVTHIVKCVLDNCQKELELLERDLKPLQKVKPPFPRISYTECIDLLKKGKIGIKWGEDLGAPHEKFISKQFEKPVAICKYPGNIKAFYMQPDPENPELVLNNDMLAPEGYGEIIGGSERIWDLKILEEKVKKMKIPKQAYNWYLDLRRYGSVPHSGFGMGIERMMVWICKLKHIRETIPYPRTITRLYP